MTDGAADGYRRFRADDASRAWCRAALGAGRGLVADPQVRAANLRHDGTWFVGVDALPNAPDGSIGGVALDGPWRDAVPVVRRWHRAQLSIVYPGYPGRDAGESDAAHRYRVTRGAAHVDGLLAEGARRRRFPREFHAFILGLPLTSAASAPTICWAGSHRVIARALRVAIGDRAPAEVDVTDAYHAARREVFETCPVVELGGDPGAAFLLHRFTLHGTAPWRGPAWSEHGRMIAFFRPELPSARAWLDRD